MASMSRGYKIVPTQSTTPAPPALPAPQDWTTGLCDCAGQNACCTECCLVVFGLDYLLYKDRDEDYIERQRGLKHGTYMPDPGTLEAFIGGTLCRGLGVLMTCGLAAGSGGVFDLFWCHTLSRQRRQVRDMYRIGGDPCSDCFLACCCRCCMFNQLKHQLEADNPNPPSTTPEQMNSMRADKESYRNKTWTVSDKEFNNPTNRNPNNPKGLREYL